MKRIRKIKKVKAGYLIFSATKPKVIKKGKGFELIKSDIFIDYSLFSRN